MNATKILLIQAAAGAGDVTGPASSTDNALVRFDGAGGKTMQNSVITVADTTGAMTWAAAQDASFTAGSSGASLVLGQGANGAVTITPKGTGNVGIGVTGAGDKLEVKISSASAVNNVLRLSNTLGQAGKGTGLVFYSDATPTDALYHTGRIYSTFDGASFATARTSIQTPTGLDTWFDTLTVKNSNVLIGGTTDITGTGGLKVFGTTASTSSITGALIVAGGVASGDYFSGKFRSAAGAAGANFGPAGVVSITVVDGIVTAIS